LKDLHGGRVTVISMGPPQAENALRKCISFGADDAILITDRAFAGADTLATSFALAAAIQKIDEDMKVDLVFAGKQTIDGDTAQVGPGVAKRLDMQLLTYVSSVDEVDLEKRTIKAQRRAEGGVQLLTTSLPCMVTMLEGSNEMRFATMDNMFRAARLPLKIWNKDDAGITDPGKIGLKGSPTLVSKVFAPQPNTKPAEMIETESGEPRDVVITLLGKLNTQHPKLSESIARIGM
jgi:electron transfer flavoprotein beta subunit